MRRCILAIVVLLAFSAFPSMAAGESTSLGVSAGITGRFSDGAMFIPVDLVIQSGDAGKGMFLRTDLGIVYGLQSSYLYLDANAALGYPIFAGIYGMAGLDVWVPLSSALDMIDDSILLLKPAIGYQYKGFFAELAVPFMVTYAEFVMHAGWEIRAGYRFQRKP
jgi:hypothetical protein